MDDDNSDVRIWILGRAAQQVLETYNADFTGSETGLFKYLKFDDISGTTLVDSSKNIANASTLCTSASFNSFLQAV